MPSLLLLAIGGGILMAPHAFHGSNGIALGDNPNLLSEIRAPGGLLASSGIVILIGAFRMQLRSQAVQLTALVYGSFGLARLISMALDGMPSSSIVGATLLELIGAFFGFVILWRWRTWPYCLQYPVWRWGFLVPDGRGSLLYATPKCCFLPIGFLCGDTDLVAQRGGLRRHAGTIRSDRRLRDPAGAPYCHLRSAH